MSPQALKNVLLDCETIFAAEDIVMFFCVQNQWVILRYQISTTKFNSVKTLQVSCAETYGLLSP